MNQLTLVTGGDRTLDLSKVVCGHLYTPQLDCGQRRLELWLFEDDKQSKQRRVLVVQHFTTLGGGLPRSYENRKHFYATAAVAMRQVVVDYARHRLAERRGSGAEHTSLDALEGGPIAIDTEAERLVQIDDALTRLARLDPRLVQIVEMRFFSGLEVSEIAELLGVSESTVKRDSRVARAFLEKELEPT